MSYRILSVPNSMRLSDDSSSAAEGDIDEPEPTSHEGDSSLLTSTTVESSSMESSTNRIRGKRKQASKFCDDWCKGREHWLKYLPGQGMFCALCQKHKKSPFSRGTWNTAPCTRLSRTFQPMKLVQLIRML